MANLILGLDPGTRRTGFGVIDAASVRLRHIDHGTIILNETWSLPKRLAVLAKELDIVLSRHKIAVTVVEKIFFGKNADSAFKLGHARGVCLMMAAQHEVAVQEYAARFVKKCVTGSGAASKDHVQMVVFAELNIRPVSLSADASDALALAITHARETEARERLRTALEKSL